VIKDACLYAPGLEPVPADLTPATGRVGPFLISCWLDVVDGVITGAEPIPERYAHYRAYTYGAPTMAVAEQLVLTAPALSG
jgi:hypothetical protein